MLPSQEVKLVGVVSDSINLWSVCGNKFEIDMKYDIIEPLGQGAYGVVVAANEKESEDLENNQVAIKKIEKAFEHKIFMQRTLRELKILRLLQHENLIGIKTILKPSSREHFEDIYLVSDLMETDLETIIRSD